MYRRNERGNVLIVSIIFLVVLGLMGLASMDTSRIELRLSNNVEARSSAYQAAQALVDAVVATPAMTPLIGGAGYVLCTPGLANCNNQSIYMPAGDLTPLVTGGYLTGRAVMMAPTATPPPRGLGFSADKFSASSFQLTATFDEAAAGAGSASVTQGLIILTPIY